MESFCTFFFTPFLELNLLLENNSVVRHLSELKNILVYLAHSIRAFEAVVSWNKEQLFSKKTAYFSSFPSG